ncbi:MAG: acyltransferase [Acidimicrobiales bacterium]
MSETAALPWDWHGAPVPPNVRLDRDSYLETAYSFHRFASQQPDAVVLHRGASAYLGTTFDLGPSARLSVGEYTLVNAAQLIIESQLDIGDHSFIAWGVVIMDTYRVAIDPDARRRGAPAPVDPVIIEPDCWIGFGSTILPGTRLGRGAVVAARSVVRGEVPPYTTVAGNPAVPVKRTTQTR